MGQEISIPGEASEWVLKKQATARKVGKAVKIERANHLCKR
jgi:hypothetical protein